MALISILLMIIFAFCPVVCIAYVIKGKKNWLFSLITILFMVVLVGVDGCLAGGAGDFHSAAFILQLFMPVQIVTSVLVFIVGNLALLSSKGFFTKKRLKNILITALAIIILITLGFMVMSIMEIIAYKRLPDIVYTSDYIGHTPSYLGDDYQDHCVIWDSEKNDYTTTQVDDELFYILDKHEYDHKYEQLFEGTEYEKSFVRRSCLDSNTQKVYLTIGGNFNEQFNPYHKLLCYDMLTESLEPIIDIDTSINDFDISDDGSYIVYETKDKLIRYDILSKKSTVIKDGIEQKKKAAADEYFVRLSKDGKYIMYFYGSTPYNMFRKYIFIYDVENDSIQKVQVKPKGFYNANWYES